VKSVILGAKGQLGRDLIQVFGEAGETHGFDLPELDVAEPGAVLSVLCDLRPDVVVNAAAYTNVEGAEEHEADAYRGNEAGAREAAAAAADLSIQSVLISTDFVFDGEKREPYEPDDPTEPLSVYGQSKLAGEVAARHADPKILILRTAWLYGPGGNSFPEKILAAAQTRPKLKVVSDEVGSPTHTWDLAEATHAAVVRKLTGTHHAVNTGSCSRDEFAREILKLAGSDTPVESCSSDEFPTKARRPAYSVLSVASLEAGTGYRMRPWREALAHYIARRSAVPA
jgi:dTDP-4-dehydrorhamnose reductase